MSSSEETGGSLSEAQIAVHWREEEYLYPSTAFIGQANAADPAIYKRFAEERFPECFREYADLLDWDTVLAHNARHHQPARFGSGSWGAASTPATTASTGTWPLRRTKPRLSGSPSPRPKPHKAITYRELYRRVNELAAMLKGFCGLQSGDRVTFHMPMVPDLPVSMLACARLGVVHSEVFAGFSGTACGGRIADSGSRVLVTIDGYYRDGKWLDHKAKADEAVAVAKSEGVEIEKVLVFRRHPGEYRSDSPMVEGRDYFVDEVIGDYLRQVVPPVPMPAEAPLFLMYTSGTTGRPKGAQHSTGGYLSYVAGTSKYFLDIHPEDTYWCVADIGWITGHSYIVYGPLALGHHERALRGGSRLPRPGTALEDCRTPRRQYLPYRPHHDPNAAQARQG